MRNGDSLDFRSPAEKAYDLIDFLAREGEMVRDRRVRAAKRILASGPSDEETVREATQQILGFLARSPSFRRARRDRNPSRP